MFSCLWEASPNECPFDLSIHFNGPERETDLYPASSLCSVGLCGAEQSVLWFLNLSMPAGQPTINMWLLPMKKLSPLFAISSSCCYCFYSFDISAAHEMKTYQSNWIPWVIPNVHKKSFSSTCNFTTIILPFILYSCNSIAVIIFAMFQNITNYIQIYPRITSSFLTILGLSACAFLPNEGHLLRIFHCDSR